MLIVLLLFFISGVGPLVVAATVVRRAKNKRLARFDSRELLSVTELCGAYYPHAPPGTVVEHLATISDITEIEAQRLRPADRFDVELKLLRGNYISGEWEEVEEAIAHKRREVRSFDSVLTIGDYIKLMGADPWS